MHGSGTSYVFSLFFKLVILLENLESKVVDFLSLLVLDEYHFIAHFVVEWRCFQPFSQKLVNDSSSTLVYAVVGLVRLFPRSIVSVPPVLTLSNHRPRTTRLKIAPCGCQPPSPSTPLTLQSVCLAVSLWLPRLMCTSTSHSFYCSVFYFFHSWF